MRGKDKRVMPLLYALAFFAVTEGEMMQAGLSPQDKNTIKKVDDCLSFVSIFFLRPWTTWE